MKTKTPCEMDKSGLVGHKGTPHAYVIKVIQFLLNICVSISKFIEISFMNIYILIFGENEY